MPRPSATALSLHADRLFSSDPAQRTMARTLYETVKDLPIISPHGHTDPSWFATNAPFANPAELLITPDHYVFRMLYSQGIPMEHVGVPRADGGWTETDPRKIWRLFAENYWRFRGTPSRLWHDWVYSHVFGLKVRLGPDTADHYYEVIAAKLAQDDFLPRALFERFNIEVIATTESPLDLLEHHQAIANSGWKGRVITAFRPDPVLDPDYEGFVDNLRTLSEITGQDALTYAGYLAALRDRRAYFKAHGATSTDHGHPTAKTLYLSGPEAETLFARVTRGPVSSEDAETFRAHMLVEMAGMSLEDGLVMQIHPGSFRNHNAGVFSRFGRDKGSDIPTRTDYVRDLKPLLDRYGNDPRLSVIVFTLDESTYARELAPLAGHYPALKLGPAWWFHDSPEGMRRFREMTTETAGFYNTVGFNDDTRAFLSIPARHDVARRMDCAWLAQLVCDHRLEADEAAEIAYDLAYRLAKEAYRL
ncbi:glucuronate isomerase [Aquidulcibacter sp.]|uniref:glucuronate isomerase n=1 Tax=Aquidulcibacter sp. TaxID=2052990 RepID=UPI0025C2A1B7|nr:glucuronate isomerase [Aquidulcibacter sp.]MCA3692931.1 glucuronate isomerase [Aquidulcibacter sp.]